MIRHLCLALLLAGAARPAWAVASPAQARFDAVVGTIEQVMMNDPHAALKRARGAERLANAIPDRRRGALAAARAQWLQGESLSRLDRPGEALPAIEHALATVQRVAPADPLHGDILLSRGWGLETSGHIAAGLADFRSAFVLYRAAGDARGQSKALQSIAGIYQDAGDTDRAQRFYTQAAEVYAGDPGFTLAAYNNVGEILRSQGRYPAAEQQYALALAAARRVGSPLLQANILTNLASTRVLRGDTNGADRFAARALALTDRPGAADERPFVWGVLAQIAHRRGDAQAAATLIGRTFTGVDLTRSTLPFRDFHKLAADIYQDVGRNDLALAHLRAWKRLDDNVRAVAQSTTAALMAARFDFSTQNLRIAQLQANRARLHETVLVVAVTAFSVVSGLLLFGLISLRRSRNQTRDANHQLVKALQAKTDFLAMTSHEIRTPLNGILGMTQVMLADAAITGPLRARIGVVHGAGETMRALVDDILDLSKMETGKLTIERSRVRLPAVIEDAVGLWRGKASAKQLTLEVDAVDCPELIEEDGSRLRQILLNLLSNAIKFTETGGIVVRVRADGDQVAIGVQDSGIGIAPELHEMIFEKFQQADSSTARRFGGTGLGLAICRNLAHAMGGDITVSSVPGEGSTMTLVLPLRRLALPAAPEQEVRATAPVLLLEPNALARRMMSKLLTDAGREVLAVPAAAALLEQLDRPGVEIAIVQAAAAGADLATIAARTRSAGGRLVVLATADDDVSAIAQSPDCLVLRKPVATEALLQAVRGDTPLASAA